jgi:hypothetical protein
MKLTNENPSCILRISFSTNIRLLLNTIGPSTIQTNHGGKVLLQQLWSQLCVLLRINTLVNTREKRKRKHDTLQRRSH